MTDPAPIHADFAQRLQLLCDRLGMPGHRQRITAVASYFGVSSETARLWFAGRTLPELTRLIEMAQEFHCSLDWLVLGRMPNEGAGPFQVAEAPAGYASLSREEQSVIRGMRNLSTSRRAGLVALLK